MPITVYRDPADAPLTTEDGQVISGLMQTAYDRMGSTVENQSTLAAVIEAYMRAKGFHPTGETGLWGHPHLGEGRRYWDCVQWQVGREVEGSDGL